MYVCNNNSVPMWQTLCLILEHTNQPCDSDTSFRADCSVMCICMCSQQSIVNICPEIPRVYDNKSKGGYLHYTALLNDALHSGAIAIFNTHFSPSPSLWNLKPQFTRAEKKRRTYIHDNDMSNSTPFKRTENRKKADQKGLFFYLKKIRISNPTFDTLIT